MQFVCYNDWTRLPASADKLFAQVERGSLFFSRPWFESLTAVALEDEHTLVLACVLAGNKVMAILPLMQCPGNTWYSLKHRYSSQYSLLLVDEEQEKVLACLARGLAQLPVRAFLLEPVTAGDSRMQGLQHAMEATGFSTTCKFRHYNWIYRLQGQNYKDYMAARPARLRNTISRKQRKLEREHGYDIRLFSGAEVARGMADYYRVYNSSWKANEQYSDFVDDIVTAFSRQGWTRLAVLYVKGQPVAAQLWFVLHGRAHIFRLAYDEAWKAYSIGSILTRYLMEYVIDSDKVNEIDFLTGNDAYKQDWMSQRRECYALSFIKIIPPAGVFKLFVKSLQGMLKRK